MKPMQSFYKTSSLYKNGLFILVSLIVLFIIGVLFIPHYSPNEPVKQVYTLNGNHLKYNDDLQISYFIKSIKKNRGYLCFGTSESGSLNNGNYYDYLNHDHDIEARFSILTGAGRTCGIQFPWLIKHKKELDSLRIIYLINPVYWREDLVEVDPSYWNRYSNYGNCKSVDLNNVQDENIFSIVNPYYDKLNLVQKVNFRLEYYFRKVRRHYFQDLSYFIKPNNFYNYLQFVPEEKDMTKYSSLGEFDISTIDTNYNVFKSFHNYQWFKPIQADNDYRYEELEQFISLCKQYRVKATFIIGPLNKHFVEQHEPEAWPDYQACQNKIKSILDAQNVDYIDARDINPVRGAFSDHQHHSNYGAYLIYKKIKEHINEK